MNIEKEAEKKEKKFKKELRKTLKHLSAAIHYADPEDAQKLVRYVDPLLDIEIGKKEPSTGL